MRNAVAPTILDPPILRLEMLPDEDLVVLRTIVNELRLRAAKQDSVVRTQ
jgi:hypothetical protein